MYSPYPPLEAPRLRLANAADIDRLAELSVLGFKDSEIFQFLRPHYDEFPVDAISSFANIYPSHLLDGRYITVVAEDDWAEGDGIATLDPGRRRRVVVGVASWRLPEGSPRTGQFVVPDAGDAAPTPDGDLCRRTLELFTQITKAAETRYLTGAMICDKLAVHPSYRCRGHATAMLRWGLRLCDLDGVDQGVVPSHMGEPLYVALGYRGIGEMVVPDDGTAKGFTQRVVLYSARQGGV